jgi:DNA modification methylase
MSDDVKKPGNLTWVKGNRDPSQLDDVSQRILRGGRKMTKFSPHVGLFEELSEGKHSSTLGEKFLLPPFTVLNAREGWWQDRKRAWLELGIKSELGRGENLEGGDAVLFSQKAQNRLTEIMKQKAAAPSGLTWTGAAANFDHYRVKEGTREETQTSGTSIFDPIICELAYRWFCPLQGVVLDPFAGGSVRGIVASKLGHKYIGIDLSSPQVKANRIQAEQICTDTPPPIWHNDDSRNVASLVTEPVDFVFTCPPYADLEVYSDDPKDLSNLGYKEFQTVYSEIIKAACAKLKPNRFAAIVVGDVRGKDGCYYNFPGDTINAFVQAGLKLYNEAILITAIGSLPIRITRQFEAGRKLGKTHQNVYIFVKGDPKKAADACKEDDK